jgi:DNA-binding CsgD family transcriptional regulator
MNWRRVRWEGLLVAVVATFQVAGTYAAAQHQPTARSLDVGSTLLLLAGRLSLPLRRRAPWLTIGVALVAVATYFAVGYPGGPIFASVVVCLIALNRDRLAQTRTAREHEREVLALVGAGLSNEQIAARLVLSPATAKTHVSRVMTKLAVRDRAGLVVLAYETGLVRPGWG